VLGLHHFLQYAQTARRSNITSGPRYKLHVVQIITSFRRDDCVSLFTLSCVYAFHAHTDLDGRHLISKQLNLCTACYEIF
jgi:hypothetical protein